MMYILQVTIYTGILYMVYLLFLKNKTSHRWSRAYLLMNMAVPFLLPLVSIPFIGEQPAAMSEIILPVFSVGAQVSEQANSISWLPLMYICISSVLSGYLIAQTVQIVLFIKRHSAEAKGKVKLITNTTMGPGSWFNYVFIPGPVADEAVLLHEAAHVQYKHSYDVLLIRLLQCFAWPNIVLWLIGKELKIVHEFQADAVAGSNREAYGQTLLNELFHTKHFALSHTFFHHPIKRRLMMLQKNNSHAGKMKVVALALLLVSGMLFVQCAKDGKSNSTGNAEIENIVGPEGMDDIDKMPQFDGNLMDFLIRNVVYPQSAKDKKIEGKVIVKLGIGENGDIETINVLRSPDEALTKAALEAINKMPKWIPGEKGGKPAKIFVTLPISFKLEVPEPTAFEKMPATRFMAEKVRIDEGTLIFASGGC